MKVDLTENKEKNISIIIGECRQFTYSAFRFVHKFEGDR